MTSPIKNRLRGMKAHRPETHQVFLTFLAIFSMALEFLYPHYAVMAAAMVNPVYVKNSTKESYIQMDLDADYNGSELPTLGVRKPRAVLSVQVTAFSSTPDQTDDDPLITAWGTKVRDGIVAANFLPLGANIQLPELYPHKFFRVEDRMNPRYDFAIDVWMPSRQAAQNFGSRVTRMEIY